MESSGRSGCAMRLQARGAWKGGGCAKLEVRILRANAAQRQLASRGNCNCTAGDRRCCVVVLYLRLASLFASARRFFTHDRLGKCSSRLLVGVVDAGCMRFASGRREIARRGGVASPPRLWSEIVGWQIPHTANGSDG